MYIDATVAHLGHYSHIQSLGAFFVEELGICTHTIAVDVTVDLRLEDKPRVALVVLHKQAEVHSRRVLSYAESYRIYWNTVNSHLVYMPASSHAALR